MIDQVCQGGKIYREESPKGKSPSNTTDVGTSDESKEDDKGKYPYIASITGGAPQENISSKGIMKRYIFEIMVVYKKDASKLEKVPDRPMLMFRDSNKVALLWHYALRDIWEDRPW